MRYCLGLAALMIMLLRAGVGHAVPLVWTLQDFTFDDGATATGSFVFDADTNTFSSVAIATSAGFASPGSSYSAVTLFADNATIDVVAVALADLTGIANLAFELNEPLTNAGGTIGVNIISAGLSPFEGVCDSANCFATSTVRSVQSGAVSTQVMRVGEPSAFALLGFAILALGGVPRRS